MGLFVVLTEMLRQKGSAESKDLHENGEEKPFRLLSGRAHANAERAAHGEEPIGVLAYLGSARFWFESFQNWQSEFLSVGALIVLSIFLRQRGSAQSKPVSAPHAQTGA
jgi:hypothetical protein